MRSRLLTILVLVVAMAVAGGGVLSAAGNGPLDSLNPSGEQRLSTPDQANPPLPADDAPLSAACVPGAAYNPACDVDHNGAINVTDIQLTAGHWGQTGTYTAGAAPPCFDLTHRYVDCANGTVTDTVTGLIWLKNAELFWTSELCCRKQRGGRATNGRLRPDRQLHARRLAVADPRRVPGHTIEQLPNSTQDRG